MEFKFNSRTRIKIPLRVLGRFRNEDYTHINIRSFAVEVGLKMTSIRYCKLLRKIYYFQVIDKNKYMLAKILYDGLI